MPTNEATVFWRVYETLQPIGRRALAVRILRDRKLLEDFIDHALIEKAKRVRGKSLTLNEYEAKAASKVAC
ncbi:MAG: hypothetical protein HYX90_09420 [Chloroflexi bacterium]|nr:hypothetical protein [Chloroflexota bacterium]